MFVWTEKAERDYRIKYPHRKNEHKAGEVVKWDGKILEIGSILEGYAERGWIREQEEEKPVTVKKNKNTGTGHYLSKRELQKRWCKLRFYMSQPGKMSIEMIAQKMGHKSHHCITDMVASHGLELAAKFGKLPYYPSLRSPKWKQVMEDKQ